MRGDNIFDVVAHGTPDELRSLIAAGGKVDAVWNEGETPLHRAVRFVRVDQARVLLENQAPLDASTKFGGSPLFECAARRELLEMASLLLERGADPNCPSRYDGGPLHAAAYHGNVDLIELLSKSGAVIDTPNQQGWTPLHIAARGGHSDAVATLLRLGANPFVFTPDGKVAARLASSAKVRQLLPATNLWEVHAAGADGEVIGRAVASWLWPRLGAPT